MSAETILMRKRDKKGNEKEEEEESGEKSTLVFVMFYALGTLSFMPMSFYVMANDYWMYKFRDPYQESTNSSDTKTDFQAKFTSYYSIVANISMVIGMAITVFLAKSWLPQRRIVITLSCLLGLFTVTVLFAWIDTDTWQMEFFVISLLIGALLTVAAAIFLLSIFHVAMKFPAVYLGAVLSGQSICGILSALIQIITLAMGTSSQVNATLYFIIGIAFTAVVQVLYMTILVKRKYYQHRMNRNQREPLKLDRHTTFMVVKKIYIIMVAMVLVSGVMVSVHPGVTSLIESTNKGYGRWGDVFFVPVCTFLTSHAFDFIAREFSSRFQWITSQWILFVIAVLRLGFIPAILFCNIQPRHHLPVYIEHDWEYFFIIVLLAFTYGYVANLCVVRLPSICNEEEMEFASVLIILVMVASLTVFSLFGPVLIALV